MRQVTFRHLLDKSHALRVRFELEQGAVVKFVVQLEGLFGEKWILIRCDTAQDSAHCNQLHPYKPARKIDMFTQNYNEALTFAIQDLSDNWMAYRQRYELWLKDK